MKHLALHFLFQLCNDTVNKSDWEYKFSEYYLLIFKTSYILQNFCFETYQWLRICKGHQMSFRKQKEFFYVIYTIHFFDYLASIWQMYTYFLLFNTYISLKMVQHVLNLIWGSSSGTSVLNYTSPSSKVHVRLHTLKCCLCRLGYYVSGCMFACGWTVPTIHKQTYNLIYSNQDDKDNILKCIT
jgi:hypothetical protein